MPSVQHARGTRSALDALATGGDLLPGQIYVITDEDRIAVALTTSTYEAFAKEDEAGGGSLPTGGTTGQVLTKQSATDGDADWEDAAASVTTGVVKLYSSLTSSGFFLGAIDIPLTSSSLFFLSNDDILTIDGQGAGWARAVSFDAMPFPNVPVTASASIYIAASTEAVMIRFIWQQVRGGTAIWSSDPVEFDETEFDATVVLPSQALPSGWEEGDTFRLRVETYDDDTSPTFEISEIQISLTVAIASLSGGASDGPVFYTVVKDADETRVNDTAYTQDAALVSPTLEANSVYRFEMMLLMSGDTAQDLRFRVERSGLSDATLLYAGDLDNPVAATLTWNTNQNNNLAGAPLRMGNYVGVLQTGDNTGTLYVAWGQQVSGEPANATTMRAGSMLMLRKVA